MGIFNCVPVINGLLAPGPTCRCSDGSAHLLGNDLLGGWEMTFALIIPSDIGEQQGGNFGKWGKCKEGTELPPCMSPLVLLIALPIYLHVNPMTNIRRGLLGHPVRCVVVINSSINYQLWNSCFSWAGAKLRLGALPKIAIVFRICCAERASICFAYICIFYCATRRKQHQKQITVEDAPISSPR